MTELSSTVRYILHIEAAPGGEAALFQYMQLLPSLMTRHANCWCSAQPTGGMHWVVTVEWSSFKSFSAWSRSDRTAPLDHLFTELLISRLEVCT